MKFPAYFASLAFLLGTGLALAEEKKVEFQGKVSEVDLSAKTITVHAGKKDFVFQIDPQRCNVVKDGNYPFISGADVIAFFNSNLP